MSQLPKPFPRGRRFVQLFPTLRLVFAFYFAFCAFGFYFILLALPFRFCSSLFSFSAAAPGMIVLQGSLIPCRITDAQICHPLSRVFLSLFLCRSFCLSGYNLLDRVFPFCISSAANQPLFFPFPAQGMTGICSVFISISPLAFNFFPLLFCMFFNVFTPGQVNILSFNILSYTACPHFLLLSYSSFIMLFC